MARDTLRRTRHQLAAPAPERAGAPFALTTHHSAQTLERHLRAQAQASGVVLQIVHTRAFWAHHVDGWADGACADVRHFLRAIEPLALPLPHLTRRVPRLVPRYQDEVRAA